MAIVNCPQCDNNISSLTTICPYCDFERGELAEEALRGSRRAKISDEIYRLKMTSYVALALLLVAFGWFMTDTAGFQHRGSPGPYILFALAALMYLFIRLLLLKSGIALKKLRK